MKYDFEHWDKTEMTREEALAWFESEFEVTDGKRCSPTCPQCQAEEWAIKALKMTDNSISRKELLSRTIYNPLHAPYVTKQDVEDMPLARPEPTKGMWIKREGLYQCSACEGFFVVPTPFCPNCGAYLRKEKTDEM